MKRLLLLILLGGWLLPLGAVKVAIVGDPAPADLTVAGASNLNGVELLERAAVAEALREVDFSRITGSELRKRIGHAEWFVVFDPARRVIVFDARRGCRLADFGYRDTDAATADHATATLARLLASAEPSRKLPELGIAIVNDLGVPRRLKSAVAAFLAALEAKLASKPELIFLERSSLGTVNAERELSDTRFPLDPATLLLRFDFEPGSEAEIVVGTAKITKRSGRILETIREENIYAGVNVPERFAEAIAAAVCRLSAKPSPGPSAPPRPVPSPVPPDGKIVPKAPRRLSNPECETFLRAAEAYVKKRETAKALESIEAAMALLPENEKAKLEPFRKRLYRKNIAESWNRAQERERSIDSIRRDFFVLNLEPVLTKYEEFRKRQYAPDPDVEACAELARRLVNDPPAALSPPEKALQRAWRAEGPKKREIIDREVAEAIRLAPDNQLWRGIRWRQAGANCAGPFITPAELKFAISYLEHYQLLDKVDWAFGFPRPPDPRLGRSGRTAKERCNDPKLLANGKIVARMLRELRRKQLPRTPSASIYEACDRLEAIQKAYFDRNCYFDYEEFRNEAPEGMELMLETLADCKDSEADLELGEFLSIDSKIISMMCDYAVLQQNREACYRHIDVALRSKFNAVQAAGFFWQLLQKVENNPKMTDEEVLELLDDYYRNCRFLGKALLKFQNERNLFPPRYAFEVLPDRDLRALFRKARERTLLSNSAQTNRSTP